MTLAVAMEALPIEKKAFNRVRYRWDDIVRGLPLLTSAEEKVGLQIARYINQDPQNPGYRTAWAGHKKIASKTNLTRRTVISSITKLKQLGLIAIEQGAGVPGLGGWTDRYTLRIDRLDELEHFAEACRKKEVKSFHRFDGRINDGTDGESREKFAGSGEISDRKTRNVRNEDVKGLHPTPSNNHLNNSSNGGPRARSGAEHAATPKAANGRKEVSYQATAQDQYELAHCVGEGNVERGYNQLGLLGPANVNELALRYRLDPSSWEAIRAEADRLRELPARPG
jgi:Helix-turn-helix domain